MKRLFIPCALVLLGSLPSYAQSPRFGVKAGVNYSTTYIADVTRPNRVFGLAAGAFAQVPLSRNGFLWLQPELLYSAKGSETKVPAHTYRTRLYYLELPVLAKINRAGVVVEAGPQLSYLLAGHLESFYGTSLHLNRWVVGAVAGVGYQLPMGLGLTLRYAHDLSRLIEGGERNTLYQLQVSYALPGA